MGVGDQPEMGLHVIEHEVDTPCAREPKESPARAGDPRAEGLCRAVERSVDHRRACLEPESARHLFGQRPYDGGWRMDLAQHIRRDADEFAE